MLNANPVVYSTQPGRTAVAADEALLWDEASEGAASPPPSASASAAAAAGGPWGGRTPRLVTSGVASSRDAIDALEVFELLRNINDPEHPLTLEQLNVASLDLIEVDDAAGSIDVRFTPTIPHCSMATLIGLCIRVKLMRSLTARSTRVRREGEGFGTSPRLTRRLYT
jgi:metal-sulfur cluster biosynthetic enzyme